MRKFVKIEKTTNFIEKYKSNENSKQNHKLFLFEQKKMHFAYVCIILTMNVDYYLLFEHEKDEKTACHQSNVT